MNGFRKKFFTFFILLFAGLYTAGMTTQDTVSFDILFINGRILDGTGNPWFYADIGIQNGIIAAIGDLKDKSSAKQIINIKGKIICPGFIDSHTHAYDPVTGENVWTGKDEKRFFAPNFISQGVTTVISNQCGYSPLSIKTQREVLTKKGIGPNTVLMIGHNAIRRSILKNDFRRPASPEEIEAMKALVHRAMEDGAGGLSTGLEYVPCIWSTKDEIIALVKEIVPFGGVYQVHERASGLTPMWYVPSRDEPSPPTMLENIIELIQVNKKTGARVIATHIKARGADFWGGSRIINRMITEARNNGIDIWADGYPYTTSGSDGSTVIIPGWALKKPDAASLKTILADPDKKKSLIQDILHNLNWRGGPENILVMEHPDPDLIGKSLAFLAEKWNLSPEEAVIKLQLEGDPEKRGGARLRGFSMAEIDVEAFAAQPWTATCSDAGIALPEDGPVHPRYYGTFPRKIRRYALERKAISLENAVRSSTSLPALIHSLDKRGLLREGFWADIVVFDLEKIKDTATVFEPHQYASGIEYVLVNGTFVVQNGELTWAKPGRVLCPHL
ncbi:MAG: amidohydrolase family protein [Candidatus Aminicenantes bacterium]|nr:amidohydrolase family protein [Candidatus Aminicenantes bacterium]